MIKPYLFRKGMTQKQLAEKTGIAQSTISNYIRGMQIHSAHAEAIHRVLGIPLNAMRPDVWPRKNGK